MNQLGYEGLLLESKNVVLLSFIAAGAQTEVWLAKEIGEASNREVAVRISYQESAHRLNSSTEYLRKGEAFNKECEIWKKFQSRFVVMYHYSIHEQNLDLGGTDYDLYCQVMEYSKHGNLRRAISENYIRNSRMLLDWLHSMAQSLKVGNNFECIHADIKPENFLICEEIVLFPKIMDFGISILITSTFRPKGTEYFMAPEIEEGGDASVGTDIYSLGVVYFCMLTGEHERKARETLATEKFLELMHKRFNFADDTIPSRLAKLVRDMTAAPADRVQIGSILNTLNNLVLAEGTKSLSQTDLSNSPINVDTYRWNTSVHEVLGEKIYYCIVNTSSVLRDYDLIIKLMSEININGYMINFIIGRDSFLMRIWLTDEKFEEFEAAMIDLEVSALAHNSYEIIRIDKYNIYVDSKRELLVSDRGGLCRHILSCADKANPENESTNLLDANLITSVIGDDIDRGIRVYLIVIVREGINELERQGLVTKFLELFGGFADQITNLSTYQGMMLTKPIVLFRFRLRAFDDYSAVSEAVVTEANELNVALKKDITFRTYFELRNERNNDSDDGSIVAALLTELDEFGS